MRPTTYAPAGYECPFCRLQTGVVDDHNQASDVVAVTDRAYARVAPKWWPANAGGALVIPRRHVENLYEMEPDDGHAVWDLTQQVAKAMRRAYGCGGSLNASAQRTGRRPGRVAPPRPRAPAVQ